MARGGVQSEVPAVVDFGREMAGIEQFLNEGGLQNLLTPEVAEKFAQEAHGLRRRVCEAALENLGQFGVTLKNAENIVRQMLGETPALSSSGRSNGKGNGQCTLTRAKRPMLPVPTHRSEHSGDRGEKTVRILKLISDAGQKGIGLAVLKGTAYQDPVLNPGSKIAKSLVYNRVNATVYALRQRGKIVTSGDSKHQTLRVASNGHQKTEREPRYSQRQARGKKTTKAKDADEDTTRPPPALTAKARKLTPQTKLRAAHDERDWYQFLLMLVYDFVEPPTFNEVYAAARNRAPFHGYIVNGGDAFLQNMLTQAVAYGQKQRPAIVVGKDQILTIADQPVATAVPAADTTVATTPVSTPRRQRQLRKSVPVVASTDSSGVEVITIRLPTEWCDLVEAVIRDQTAIAESDIVVKLEDDRTFENFEVPEKAHVKDGVHDAIERLLVDGTIVQNEDDGTFSLTV